ncbi:MAG: DUF559 domain-containing protein, partial [Planctomycetes bacterium]|nr:DUF559 domain-containing protein [Planctomycetota bacterium]
QCAVEHGLPPTYRGRRIVIAGDEQQLQPSMQFQARSEFVEEDEPSENEEEVIDTEAVEADSILRLAKTRFPQRMLTWHYRSKFPELIDFSNHGFYDGRLKTVPDTLTDGALAPISYIKVEDGEWRKRTNRPEAERVVEEVYQLLLKHGGAKSIGVITFNITQREMILNVIDARSNEDHEFGEVFTRAFSPPDANLDQALFVKNIENVQGDERDIILFSIGYGPDEDGRVRAAFGSLSQEGGENRLNVAVSRAKEAIIIVASIEPEQLNVGESKNRGPRLVRAYLEYARAVARQSEEARQAVLREINPVKDAHVGTSASFESPFEEQVYEALRAKGLQVDTQVGVSGYRLDLAIVDPNMNSRYLIGIECDGATYHSAPSVRERDAYRQRFLESRGWVIHRRWSRNWWRNPEREVEAILDLVARYQSKAPAPGEAVVELPESVEGSADENLAEHSEPQGCQGEWPEQGRIKAWVEEVRDGFHWYAIADFAEKGRLDKCGWAKSRIEARFDCERAQITWLNERKIAPNLYVQPEGSAEDDAELSNESEHDD